MTPLFCNKTEFSSSQDGTILLSFFYRDKDDADSLVSNVAVNFAHFQQILQALNEFLAKLTAPVEPDSPRQDDPVTAPGASLAVEDVAGQDTIAVA